jgi:hypothetical protein
MPVLRISYCSRTANAQALTLLNDLLRNPIQPENELNGALAALASSLNNKPGRGRVRFVSKVQRKSSLLKAEKQVTSIDVSVDHSLGAPGDAHVERYVRCTVS